MAFPWAAVGPTLGGLGSIAGAVGGIFGSGDRKKSVKDQIKAQKEFAQHGIRWRVEDAKRAGIHPLFAMGGNTATFSPVNTIGPTSSESWGQLGSALGEAGQDISRAIDATRTAEEREKARQDAIERAIQFDMVNLEKAQLENDLLRAQIAKTKAPQVGPPFPNLESAMPGTGDAGDRGYEVERVRIPATQPGRRSHEAGAFPETRWVRTREGWQPVPSREAYEDADISNPAALAWYWRNQVLPTFAPWTGDPPPDELLPPKAVGWRWSWQRQEWQPAYDFDWIERNLTGHRRGERR